MTECALHLSQLIIEGVGGVIQDGWMESSCKATLPIKMQKCHGCLLEESWKGFVNVLVKMSYAYP